MVTTIICTQAFKALSLICLIKKSKNMNRKTCFMFYGLVSEDIHNEYCDPHLIKEFIIPDIMTYDHTHREMS